MEEYWPNEEEVNLLLTRFVNVVFSDVLPRRSHSALTENTKKAERGKVLQNSIGKLYLHMRVLIILGSFSGT